MKKQVNQNKELFGNKGGFEDQKEIMEMLDDVDNSLKDIVLQKTELLINF